MSPFFASAGQSIRISASASVLPMNIQDWSPLGWTGWISLQSKGLSRVFSNTTVQKRQFFSTQLYSPTLMTTGKTIALTILTFVSKVMFLLLNMLSRFVVAFLPLGCCDSRPQVLDHCACTGAIQMMWEGRDGVRVEPFRNDVGRSSFSPEAPAATVLHLGFQLRAPCLTSKPLLSTVCTPAPPRPPPPAKAYSWGTPALDPKTNSEMSMAHPLKGFLSWKVGLRSRGDQGGRFRCGIYKVEVKRV